ncbi:hypothetical protein JCGZ_09411 [Jatropha curcas]|uniref:Cytochrome P450 n=1 Tax=Jatropha curcas TaxID=180498 RepID=A0A067KGN6_JATCU|nr:alkane hydroxylase MAH1 [Jatropha curcas]KDP35252.1 hypothetical protein JCGZ_09411 [Jatropha curcas]
MALIGIFEILLATLCYVAGCWLRNRRKLIRSWPLIGTLPSLLRNINRLPDWMIELAGRKGGTTIYKGSFTGLYVICTTDPENIKHIMSTNFSNYPKGSEYKEIYSDVLGDGIFNSDSELWRNQRKNAVSLINHEKFRKFLFRTANVKVEKGLFPVLELICSENKEIDLQDLVHRFTADITFTLVTGYDQETLSTGLLGDKLGTALEYIEEALFYRHIQPKMLWKFQNWLGFGTERKVKDALKMVDDVTAKYISMRRQGIVEEGGGVNLLTPYVNEKSDKFLRDTIYNFMVAGRENSLSWFFWLLSKNPRVEAKIREELSSIVPESERGEKKIQLLELEKVNKLLYLHAALCETLRIYPPVTYEYKAPLQNDILPSGHYVDPKMKILLSSYLMGRLKSLWGEDCFEFKPERWISEQGRIIHQSPYKFLAFNAGPRTCVGKDIAFVQMKAMAAFLLHNYNIEVVEEHAVVPKYTSIILHMKYGLKVRISRRWA